MGQRYLVTGGAGFLGINLIVIKINVEQIIKSSNKPTTGMKSGIKLIFPKYVDSSLR